MRRLAPGVVAAAVLTLPASGHLVGQRFGDYYGGLLHPVTALGHAAAFLALALLAGQQPVASARRMLAGLAIALLAGCLVAPSVPAVGGIAVANRASLLVLGLLVAAGRQLPSGLGIWIAAGTGLCHGYENGLEITAALSPLLFSAGVASAGAFSATLIAAASLQPRPAWVALSARVVGSWIAALGVMMLALSATGRG